MARRVFFHIGAPKTGTTYLQTVMWENRSVLRSHGLLYPGRSRMDHYHASQNIRGNADPRVPAAADAWDRLVSEVAAWPDAAIITHEFFGMADAQQAGAAVAALAPAEVDVIFTARDYARQLPAIWQEALKMGENATFEEFMEKALRFELSGAWSWRTQNVPVILERWGQAVRPSRVHVVTVPPSGAARDLLWRRWCSVLGLDPTVCDLEVAFSNESLGAPQAEFLRRVIPHLTGALHDDGRERHRWLRAYLGHEVLVPQAGERFGVNMEQRKALIPLAEDAIQHVRESGYDVVGDLDELRIATGPDVGPRPIEVEDDELVEVATRTVAEMLGDVRRLTRDRNRWRARARAAERAQTGIWQQAAATARTRVLDAARAVRQRLG